MAITTTTLAAAFTATELRFKATAATGATVDGLVKIDQEFMVISAISGVYIDVRARGALGTTAVAHNILAPVTFCLPADLPAPGAGVGTGLIDSPRDVVSYGVAGAIALPKRDTVVLLTKASSAAMTLADPAGVPDGTFLTIVGTNASAAHTVTLTTGYGGADTTDVFTFPATVGASVTLMAYKGLWAQIGVSMSAADAANVTVA